MLRGLRVSRKPVRIAGYVILILAAAPGAFGAGFFDDIPAKGYVREDVALDVLSVGSRDAAVMARVRFLRLVLDPGRRDVELDAWPEREMLLVERASGERLVFERVTGIFPPGGADALQPKGRLRLESGGLIESFGRERTGADGACAGLEGLIRLGSIEIPVAREDLTVPTVRLGIEQLVAAALSSREIEVVTGTVPILVSAKGQGLPLGPLAILEILFPGRHFDRSAAALTFRVSGTRPLDPSGPPWSSMTLAPEMTAGVPAY
jgi:hypothetical protein